MAFFLFKLLLFFDMPAIEPIHATPAGRLWLFLPVGYLVTILIETFVLLFGLPPKLSFKQKLTCGIWLTACTYPIVVLVMPLIFAERLTYLIVAETFAPLAECFLFWLVFRSKDLLETKDWIRSFIAIIAANLASFGIGEILIQYGWFGLFQ